MSAVILGSSGILAPPGVMMTTMGRFDISCPLPGIPEQANKRRIMTMHLFIGDTKITIKSES